MRGFIALEMPDHLKDRLRPSLYQLARDQRAIKWVAPENLHLTLQFLGEVSTSKLSDLKAELAAITRQTTPFELHFERIGFFHHGGKPSVIWLGVAQHDQLAALAKQVSLASMRLLSLDDHRPFRPHVTLGRARQPYDGPPLSGLLERIKAVDLPQWSVREVSLMKSDLTPQGPIYTALARYPLGGE